METRADRRRKAETAENQRGPGDDTYSARGDAEPALCQLCSALRVRRGKMTEPPPCPWGTWSLVST